MTGKQHEQYDQMVAGFNIPQTHLDELAQVNRFSLAQARDTGKDYPLPAEFTEKDRQAYNHLIQPYKMPKND